MNITSYPSTVNGSFILPNGVIVLVEEDYEDYLNDTLVFNYHNDDLLNVNNHNMYYYKKDEEYEIIY